jgi:gamma-glutamylcyclotransferase (GGCT)/AIG2-like uncharacterized protein YtfP
MPAELPLFAYGTLLTGALDPAIDRLLARDAVSLGPARLRGRLHDQGGYPGLVDTPAAGGWVRGELLDLADPPRTLATLDRYEGFDPTHPKAGEFIRTIRRVESAGAASDAWVYLLNVRRVRPGPRIVGGDWRRYRR